jgi:hypothetical protein
MNYNTSNDYFIEDEYIFEKSNYNSFTPQIDNTNQNNLAIKPMIEYDEINRNNPQYITYMDHPNIIIENEREKEKKEKKENNEKEKEEYELNIISQIYFGSITIIGLYIFFKLLQRSK